VITTHQPEIEAFGLWPDSTLTFVHSVGKYTVPKNDETENIGML
jgi:hypothetical protein